MALLVSLARLAGRQGLRLEVASLDHGLRPQAAAETAGVAAQAQRLGLVWHCRALSLAPGAGLEERARAARYEVLEALRLERGLDVIATGHTASDQAETVLMRLGRGAALGGAAAIHARTLTLLRPMLRLTRGEVVAYLKALGQGWVEDPMNADPAFLRVRVRQQLVPAFEAAAGPRIAQHLARFAQYAEEDDGLLEQAAAAALGRVARAGLLDAIALDALDRPIRRRVIARWLAGHQLPVDAALIEDTLEAVSEGRVATLPHDQLLVSRGGWVGIERAPPRNFTSPTGVGAKDAL